MCWVQMVELMHYAELQAGLDKLPERTIELRILSVRQDWRQRGLARRLAEGSVREARESGFKAMTVCCTSEFTARLVRSMGWRQLYRLAYRDYTSLTGREVDMKITPPHEYLYYYVTDL